MELYKNFLKIDIEPEHQMLCSKWYKAMSVAEYKEGLLHAEKLLRENLLECWLVQASIFNPPVVKEQKWTIEVLLPLLLKTNLKKIAFVLPGDHFMHMLASSMIDKAYRMFGHRIKLECFTRVEHARHWLLTSDETEDAISA